jgi:hypothetical protein
MKKKYPGPELSRFEDENAAALREMREEQRRLQSMRKASGKPDPYAFMLPSGNGTVVMVCRRGSAPRP